MHYGTDGAKMPNAKSSDEKSQRHESMRGGVAMGKADAVGKDNQCNTGKTAGVCYTHDRSKNYPK